MVGREPSCGMGSERPVIRATPPRRRARRRCATLAPTQGEQVLLHQDLHGEQRARRAARALARDRPETASGRARVRGLRPIVRSSELGGDSRLDVLHRLDRLSSELGLNRERASGWALGADARVVRRRAPRVPPRRRPLARRGGLMLEGRALRRRLHDRPARPGARARGLPAAGRALRPRARPCALPRGSREGGGGDQTPPRARARRGDLGRVHRADHPRHGR